MTHAVPHFACSEVETGEGVDKTGGAPRRPCQSTPGEPTEVHPP